MAGSIQIDDGPAAVLKRGFPEESFYPVNLDLCNAAALAGHFSRRGWTGIPTL
jgi:hypothetical protein